MADLFQQDTSFIFSNLPQTPLSIITRCGEWFLSDSLGLKADIICVGKALTGGVPGGACVSRKREVLELLYPINSPPLHAPTFYNSPIVATAITASINVLEEERLLDRSKVIGELVCQALSPHLEQSIGFVEIRGSGAAQALVFENVDEKNLAHKTVTHVVSSLMEKGVLALNSGFPEGNVVTICPPLTISNMNLEKSLDVLVDVLKNIKMEDIG